MEVPRISVNSDYISERPQFLAHCFCWVFFFGVELACFKSTQTRVELMDRIIAAALVLVGSAAPALAGTPIPVPEPATLTLFGLGVGGAYLVKRFAGRK
jgi:CHASE2 domain-containing sensor protein